MSRLPAWILNIAGITYGTGRPLELSQQALPDHARTWSPDVYRKRRRTVFDLSDRVTGFEYESEEGKQDKVTLVIENQDLGYFESPVLMKGTDFSFSFGYAGQFAPGSTATVEGTRGLEQLRVEAYGKVLALTTEQKTRQWTYLTRSDIVEQIAREHGILRTRVTPGVTRVTLPQVGITDWQFLLELAEPLGFSVYFTIEQGVRVLNWQFRQHAVVPARLFEWGQPSQSFQRGMRSAPLLDFKIDDSKRKGKPSKVKATGHDPDARKPLRFTGDSTAPPTPADGPNTEIAPPEESAGRNEKAIQVVPTAHASIQWVREEAQTRYKRGQEDQMLATAMIEGDPTLTIGQIVEIARVPKYLAGNYYVKAVKHTIGGDGYRTRMKLSRNAVGPLPMGAGKQTPAPGPPNKKSARDAVADSLARLSGLDLDGEPVVIFGPSNLAR